MNPDTQAVRRILRAYRTAPASAIADGRRWYSTARAEAERIAEAYGLTLEQSAGIIAALSPRMPWAGNLRAADTVAAAYALGLKLPAVGLRRNAQKAWRIAGGADPSDVLRGNKVRAFFANILGDEDAVTVDTWAARIAGVDATTLTDRRYRIVAEAYRRAATIAGIPPATLQAITWVSIRGSAT